jgi:DNA-binding transcriptional MerR regulator
MSMLDIAQVAQRSGLPASTLRYYEEKGLIASVGRRGLRRLFPEVILERLALIDLGRTAGFSLEEIASMFAAKRIDRARLLAKAGELDRTITKLAAMRDGLRHAARCQAPTHMQCPKFRRLLKLAGKTRLRAERPRRLTRSL